jgi:predicted Zn-dependent protease
MPAIRRMLMVAFVASAIVRTAVAFAQPPSTTSSRATEAARAMKEQRYDDAVSAYRELLKARPDEPELLANLGMALALGGHEADAVAPLERAVGLNPKLTNARMMLGSAYLALDKPEKAVEALKRALAQQPSSIENRRMLAEAYAAAGRPADALAELRKITEVAPRDPAAWFALGHAYNGLAQDAMASFNDNPGDRPWRQLLLADALAEDGRLTDAFALYRSTLDEIPTMVSIHDSIARIYEQTSHADWATRERSQGVLPASECVKRKSLCEFRAGRYRSALAAAIAQSDPESRYWSARAAAELARAAFKQLESLPDSRERREIRATMARAERRYADAITELQAALKFAPNDPDLLNDLGTTYYFAKDYEKAVATLLPLAKAHPDNPQLLATCGDALLQLQRIDDAIPLLQRSTAMDTSDPAPRMSLARAYIAKEYFTAAIPLLELDLPDDTDGSVHVQLARAYKGIGNEEKATQLLERSEALQKASQERSAVKGQRAITPPK